MARSYVHVKVIEELVYEMREAGKTNREIAEELGLTMTQLKNLINRRNRAERKAAAGILPRRRGRPPKVINLTKSDERDVIKRITKEKDYEISRLKMENDLLRDFLRLAGRR
jgi:predicted transcriptional regulator